MNYKEKLQNIIDSERKKIMNSETVQRYVQIFKISEKIQLAFNDFSKINEITEEDYNLLDKRTIAIITNIKILYEENEYNEEESKYDIRKNLYMIMKNIVKEKVFNDQEYNTLEQEMTYLNNIEDMLKKNIQENYEQILSYIDECKTKELLTIPEAISLHFDITQECITNKDTLNNEVEEKILVENEKPITEELINLFKQYNYDFESLNEKIKQAMSKYVRLENAEYFLSHLNEYNVNKQGIVENQKEILKIMLDNDRTSFEKVMAYVDKNKCTMQKLLSIAPFHARTKTFIKKTEAIQNTTDLPKETLPTGDYRIIGFAEDFFANSEFYKKVFNIDKIRDEDLIDKKVFFLTSNSKIVENLNILRRYGLVEKESFPQTVTSLIGKFTAYQADRFIECNQYDYLKNNLSYISRTKSPTKFYKIRRGTDLGDIITNQKGMLKKYREDKNSSLGISQVIDQENPNNIRIKQAMFSKEQFEQVLAGNPRLIRKDETQKSKEQFLERIYYTSYKFHEFTPEYIFNYSNNKNQSYIANNNASLRNQVSEILNSDETEIYTEEELKTTEENNEFFKLFENGSCRTVVGKYPIKKDECTYEFRPLRHPMNPIIISRPKVLRLLTLLDKNDVLNNPAYNIDDQTNIILSAVVKDSILSIWELTYLRKIIRAAITNSLKKSSERGAR